MSKYFEKVKSLEIKKDVYIMGIETSCDETAVSIVKNGREVLAEGFMHGYIIDEPRGERGFGYDPFFVPVGETRTVAEMSDEEKNCISHRANALKDLLSKI